MSGIQHVHRKQQSGFSLRRTPLTPLSYAIGALPLDAYLTIDTGSLPIVFSVPHGGEVALDGAAERAHGTKVQDDRVNELAAAIQRQLLAKTGKEAYLVVVRVFGYQNPQGIDSVQLEFGANLRTDQGRIDATAAVVADALLRHLRASGYH